jgi:hypothetical protein
LVELRKNYPPLPLVTHIGSFSNFLHYPWPSSPMSACLCQSRTVPDGCHARRSRPRRASQPHPRHAPISAAGRAPCHALVVRALPCPGQRRGRRVGGPRAATGASGGDRRTVAPRQWLWQASRARSPEATTSPLRATVGGLAPLMRASAEGHGESPAHVRRGPLCASRTRPHRAVDTGRSCEHKHKALVMSTTCLTKCIGQERLEMDKSASHVSMRSRRGRYGLKWYSVKSLWA